MSDSNDNVIHAASRHGVLASHPERELPPLLVAPTTDQESNTLGLDVAPVACLQMADLLFEFDSSFILPDAAVVLKDLPALREKHKNPEGELPPLSIFGHADPVGSDDYNKTLSGRRAKAVFGLLTKDTGVWDSLYNHSAGGDDWQSKNVVAAMRRTVGASTSTPRSALFQAYMDALCPFKLTKDDFLARGAHPKGKGDFQGCGEFNPLVILSQKENQTLPKARRNAENARNRRVVVYLFEPGRKVDAALWPCPNADEPPAGCTARFFASPKGDDRRKAGPERREHEELQDTLEDTFACRFYDRISHLSACEVPSEGGYCCKYRGLVVDNLDPEQLGRLKVRVPSVLGESEVFAMPCVPYAGPSVGFLALPPVGANVWVDFEGGDPARPIWSGCFWGEGEAPAEAGVPEVKLFFKTENVLLAFDERSGTGSITVEVAGAGFAVGKNRAVEISNQGQSIVVKAGSVSFNKGALEVI